MSRISQMTWGTLLILVGVQLNLIESFVLTPQATDFWNRRTAIGPVETVPGNYAAAGNGYFPGSNSSWTSRLTNSSQSGFPFTTPDYQRSAQSNTSSWTSPFRSPSYTNTIGSQKLVTPPSWFCWPPIFLGAVLFLFGAASHE